MPSAGAGTRVVLSKLGPGETMIGSSRPSLKLLLEGEEVYRVGKKVHRLLPGRMLLVDPGDPIEVTIRRTVSTRGLCIYFDDFAPIAPGPVLGRVAMRAANATPLGASLHAMGVAAHRGDIDFGKRASAIVDCAAAVVGGTLAEAREQYARLSVRRPSTRQNVLDRVEIARAFLHDNLARNITLAELAAASGLSTFHLARYFSAVIGMPPARYHRAIRLLRARELLMHGSSSVTEIAMQLGYSELSAFTHAFRREFGMSPREAAGQG